MMQDVPAIQHLGSPLLPSPEKDPEAGILRTPRSAGAWLDAAKGLQATILSLADYILLTVAAASFLFFWVCIRRYSRRWKVLILRPWWFSPRERAADS